MEKMHWGFWEKFQSDEAIFRKRIEAAAPLYEVINDPDFMVKYSLVQIQRAQDMYALIRDWWISNRERMRKQEWMSEKSWDGTNEVFGCNGSMADCWRHDGEERD